MRITCVLPALDMSGGCRVAAIYAERLRRRGHEIVAVAVAPPPPSWRSRLAALVKDGRWLTTPKQLASHFDALDVELRRLQKRRVTDADVPDADVVVATWWETAEWVAALSPQKGKKLHFVQDHETWSWSGTRERIEAVYRLPMPKVTISGFLRDVLEKQYGRPPIALIPNSVDTEHFQTPPRGKQPVPTVGLTYATKPNKGTDICLQAFDRAAKHVPGLRLVVMSNEKIAPRLPLPVGADFTYQARDQAVRDLYARCDAWLFGTRWEGFGLPVLEAMACRTPVIGTPAGAAPELIAKGGGILVPAEDPAAMADAIIKITALPDEEWRALSEAARTTATSFTWDDAVTQFEDALKRVTAGSF
jgi:glycosyltransferase involved in cell wall biosynthesis